MEWKLVSSDMEKLFTLIMPDTQSAKKGITESEALVGGSMFRLLESKSHLHSDMI